MGGSTSTGLRPRDLRWGLPLGIVALVAIAAALAGRPAVVVACFAVPTAIVAVLLSRRDAVSLLSIYTVLLIGVPAILIVKPLGASGTPANIVGILALLWWVQARLSPGLGMARGIQPVRLAVAFLAAAIVASYAASFFRPIIPVEVSAGDRGLLVLAGSAGIALIAADGIPSRERLDTLLRRLVVLGALLALLGIVQFFSGYDIANLLHLPGLSVNHDLHFIEQRSTFRRVAGTAAHPIEFGVVLAIIFPFALHYALYPPDVDGHPARRWVGKCLAAVIAFAIPMSLSRSAIVGLIGALVVLFVSWSWPRRRQALVLMLAFGIGTRLAIPGLLGTIKSLFLHISSDPSTTGRTQDYKVVGSFVKQAPILGRGFFTYLPDHYSILDNQFLLILVEAGFVGLTALLLVFVVGFFSARGARRRATQSASRDLATSLAASMVAAGLTFVTFDALSFRMVTGVVFLVLGCCGALWRLNLQVETPEPQAGSPATEPLLTRS